MSCGENDREEKGKGVVGHLCGKWFFMKWQNDQ